VKLRIETRLLPPIVVDVDPFSGRAESGASLELAGRILQPRVSIDEPIPVAYAPWGPPGDQWIVVATAAAAALIYVIARIVR